MTGCWVRIPIRNLCHSASVGATINRIIMVAVGFTLATCCEIFPFFPSVIPSSNWG